MSSQNSTLPLFLSNSFFIWSTVASLASLISILLLFRVVAYIIHLRRGKHVKPSILAFLGSGGHTSEMIHLIQSLALKKYRKIHIIAAENRSMDYFRRKMDVKEGNATRNGTGTHASDEKSVSNVFTLHDPLPRAREVKQSWKSTIWTSLYSLLATLQWYMSNLFLKVDMVLLNGPGTCVMLVLVLWMQWILTGVYPKVIYVESVARVKSLSLTGKILYSSRSCTRFLVQWEELLERYPKAEYIGRLC